MSAPLRRRVLATAGHVDHGKSVLVQALTGTHPDRLPQERARGMSIDLGFAFWQLPDGAPVGIVDVPGHRDFIANMLAGVGLVDAVLLVVAADEGVMPQTREHVAIVDLLGVRAGVVALTKVDLVPDPGLLARRRAEVRALLQGTGLHDAPIVPVSARTGQGLDALTAGLAAVLARVPPRPDLGRPRLAIDRAFVLSGFGPVVTGTLVDGALQVGMRVQVLPGGAIARIRNLHSHGQPVTHVQPAARVAANLVGVPREALGRGRWLVLPGDDEPTTRLDAWVRVLPDAPAALRHNAQVRLHLATARVVARVRVLGDEALRPGASGFVQLLLQQPVVARRGDLGRRMGVGPAPPAAQTLGCGHARPLDRPGCDRFAHGVAGPAGPARLWRCRDLGPPRARGARGRGRGFANFGAGGPGPGLAHAPRGGPCGARPGGPLARAGRAGAGRAPRDAS